VPKVPVPSGAHAPRAMRGLHADHLLELMCALLSSGLTGGTGQIAVNHIPDKPRTMTMWQLLLVQAMVVSAILLLERRGKSASGDWRRNLQAWSLQLGTAAALLGSVGWKHAAFMSGKSMPFALGFALFFLAMDFGEFAYHLAQHKVPWLWRMHSLHHSDPDMSTLTTSRHFWGDQFIKAVTVWPLACTLIAPTPAMLSLYALLSLYNFFTHANLKIDFGRWSWVVNSPAYHRRHHSHDPAHFNTNYAAVLPIFDVIFGTYRRPTGWPRSGMASAPECLADVILWPFVRQSPQ